MNRCDKTNSGGPKKSENCVFPFSVRIDNSLRTFDACTDFTDENRKFWCSTKVNDEGVHQIGNWGYCDPNCTPTTVPRAESTPAATPISAATTTTTSCSATGAEETGNIYFP